MNIVCLHHHGLHGHRVIFSCALLYDFALLIVYRYALLLPVLILLSDGPISLSASVTYNNACLGLDGTLRYEQNV